MDDTYFAEKMMRERHAEALATVRCAALLRQANEDSRRPKRAEGVGMNNRPASLVVAIFLWLIAFAQLLRVLLRVEVRAGDVTIPLWVSSVAFIVLVVPGIWLWRERRE